MKLEDIDYFAIKKTQQPKVFNLAQKVVDNSAKDPANDAEMQRRLTYLAKSSGNEHLRQCANFIAEAITFDELSTQQKTPRWISETKDPTPDISYPQGSTQIPVEVKHLNDPRDQHEAIANGDMPGGPVNTDYTAGIQTKVEDFVKSAKAKFTRHNKDVNGVDSASGTLYIYYTKSIDADIADRIPGQIKLEDRVRNIAMPLIKDSGITLVVRDLNTSL